MKINTKKQKLLKQKELKKYFRYDTENGKLFWKEKISLFASKITIGQEAGHIVNGYRHITLDGEKYLIHRLIWFFNYGKWPEGQIDHINGNKRDNRISNLRNVTHKENHHNRKLNSNNKSGYLGVSFAKDRNKWMASISIDDRKKCLGYFENIEDAISTRKQAEVKFGYHKNHGRS